MVWQSWAVKNLIWINLTSLNVAPFHKLCSLCEKVDAEQLLVCHFMPFNEHFYPQRVTELLVNIFLAAFTCHVMWKKEKTWLWDAWAVCTYEKWRVCFWQALKRSRQMACSVWVLASVTDQGERGTEGRGNRNRETSFSTVTQTELSHLQSMPVTVWSGIGIRELSC